MSYHWTDERDDRYVTDRYVWRDVVGDSGYAAGQYGEVWLRLNDRRDRSASHVLTPDAARNLARALDHYARMAEHR